MAGRLPIPKPKAKATLKGVGLGGKEIPILKNPDREELGRLGATHKGGLKFVLDDNGDRYVFPEVFYHDEVAKALHEQGKPFKTWDWGGEHSEARGFVERGTGPQLGGANRLERNTPEAGTEPLTLGTAHPSFTEELRGHARKGLSRAEIEARYPKQDKAYMRAVLGRLRKEFPDLEKREPGLRPGAEPKAARRVTVAEDYERGAHLAPAQGQTPTPDELVSAWNEWTAIYPRRDIRAGAQGSAGSIGHFAKVMGVSTNTANGALRRRLGNLGGGAGQPGAEGKWSTAASAKTVAPSVDEVTEGAQRLGVSPEKYAALSAKRKAQYGVPLGLGAGGLGYGAINAEGEAEAGPLSRVAKAALEPASNAEARLGTRAQMRDLNDARFGLAKDLAREQGAGSWSDFYSATTREGDLMRSAGGSENAAAAEELNEILRVAARRGSHMFGEIPESGPGAKRRLLNAAPPLAAGGALALGAEDADAAPRPRIAGPKTAYHASSEPWIIKGDAPDLSRGEGLGLHVGSKEQAKARLDVPALATTREGVRIGQRPALGMQGEWLDKVTLGKGREIETPDLDTWAPSKWEGALQSGRVKGLSPEETVALIAKMQETYDAPIGQYDARLAREALRDVGIQRVRYRNEYEQPGEFSYAAIDPDIIRPHDWKKRLGDMTTTSASLGGAAGVLYPHDAEGRDSPAGDGAEDQRFYLGPPAGEELAGPVGPRKPRLDGSHVSKPRMFTQRLGADAFEGLPSSLDATINAAPTRSDELWAPVGHALLAMNPLASREERQYRLDATGRTAQNWLGSRLGDAEKLGGDIAEGVASTVAPFASAPLIMAADNYERNQASPTLGAENFEPFIEPERQAQMNAKADADKWAGAFRGLGAGGPKNAPEQPSEGPMIARQPGGIDLLGSAYAAPGGKSPADESRERIADMEEVNRRLATGSVAEKQQFLIEQGKNVRPDGRMGPETEAYLEQVRARNDAALAKERENLNGLVEREAFLGTRPTGATEALRGLGPLAAFGGGVALAEFAPKGLGRLSAVNAAKKKLVERNAQADALLNVGPVEVPLGKRVGAGRRLAANQDAVRRAERVNEFWRLGGAGENVPFKVAKTEQGFTPRPAKDVADASTLYPAGPSVYRGADLGYAALGGMEAAAMQPFVEDAKREVAAAQAALDAEKSEANYRRLEEAKNAFAQVESLQRAGIGFGAGRMVSPFVHRYPDIKPNIPGAAGERGQLNQFLKSAQPSSKPKTRPRRTTR